MSGPVCRHLSIAALCPQCIASAVRRVGEDDGPDDAPAPHPSPSSLAREAYPGLDGDGWDDLRGEANRLKSANVLLLADDLEGKVKP